MTTESHVETQDFVAEHELHIGELSTPVRIRIWRRKADGALIVEQSHSLKTGIQYLPHTANQPFTCSESEVLDKLLATMMGFYDQAVRKGYTPSEDWLMENTAFNPVHGDAR
jgi:hypothetical protein